MSTISTAHRPSFLLLWNTCVQNSGSIQFGSVHFSGCELSFMCVCLTQSVQLTLSGGISKHTFSRQHSVFSNGPYSGKLQCLQLIYVTHSTVQMFYLLTSISGIGGRGVLCVFARARVCLSASISPELHVRSLPYFCACYRLPWLGHPLAALRYVMYFRFYG